MQVYLKKNALTFEAKRKFVLLEMHLHFSSNALTFFNDLQNTL